MDWDLQALESSGSGTLDTLNQVVHWLHSAGFKHAESALLSEIELRYPDHQRSPSKSKSPENGSARASASQTGEGALDNAVDLAAHARQCSVSDSLGSAERVLEAWRSKSGTPAASPRKSPVAVDVGGTSSPAAAAAQPHPFSTTWPQQSSQYNSLDEFSSGVFDEYEDEDDVGYWRVPITTAELSAGGGALTCAPISLPEIVSSPSTSAGGGIALAPYERSSPSPPLPPTHTKSHSCTSLPAAFTQSRRSPLDLPLPLQAPVVGGTQVSELPPLPNSARGAGPASPSPRSPHPTSEGTPRPAVSQQVPYSPVSGRDSAERRAAGTARWVFDRSNSAGSDAFKSLVSFLDQSPRTQPLQVCSTDASDAGGGTAGPSPRDTIAAAAAAGATVVLASASNIPPTKQEHQLSREAVAASAGLPWAEPSAAQLADGGGDDDDDDGGDGGDDVFFSRAATAGTTTSIATSTAAAGGGGRPSPRAHPLAEEGSLDIDDDIIVPAAAAAGGGGALGDLYVEQPPPAIEEQDVDILEKRCCGTTPTREQQSNTRHQDEADEEEAPASPPAAAVVQTTATASVPRSPEGLRAVRTSNTSGGGSRGSTKSAKLRSHKPSRLTAMGGTGDGNDGDASASSPTEAAIEEECEDDDGTPRDTSDPFSFPVTSPSEHGERTIAPLPVFGGSWPSFKNLQSSPGRNNGYCSTEEESTPVSSARRNRRQRLSAASSGNLVGLPPLAPPQLGGGAGAAGGGMMLHRQTGTTTTARLGNASGMHRVGSGVAFGQYDDLALYDYDEDIMNMKYEELVLRVVHRRGATGFEPTRELPLRVNDLIAGRYQIVDLLGQAAFSRAVQALDLKTGQLVCLKVVKNNKDYFDQSLDEIKMLRMVNAADLGDEHGILRLLDYFYFKEHLILVTELLRANLYEFSKHCRAGADPDYFSPPRVQAVASQILRSLTFLHSLGVIHADLKPENILMKSYSHCEVKVIDLGSSCFVTDRLSSYVQSRSYRAPEVILGLPYGPKIDVWSLGCIIAELASGKVLFHNTSLPAILARMEGILGSIPQHLIRRGRYAHRYYTPDGRIYERCTSSSCRNTATASESAVGVGVGQAEILRPKRTSLERRVPQADPGMVDFLAFILQVDPAKRPTAAEALQHPWLQYRYS